MKTKALVKIMATAVLLGGALCWSAAAGDATGLWNANCAACHGKDGKGQTMMGRKFQIKDLTEAKVQGALTDEQAAKDIKDGVTENGQTRMKASTTCGIVRMNSSTRRETNTTARFAVSVRAAENDSAKAAEKPIAVARIAI